MTCLHAQDKIKWLKVQNNGWLLIDVPLLTTDGQLGTPQKKLASFKLYEAFEISSRVKHEALMFSLNCLSLNYFDVQHNVFWGSKCEWRLIDYESCLTLISVYRRRWSLCSERLHVWKQTQKRKWKSFPFTTLSCNHSPILDLPLQSMKEAECHNVEW